MTENRRILWEIQRQQVATGGARGDRDKADLIDFLADGWEPYAVTWDGDCFDYHLRRWFFEAEQLIDGTVPTNPGSTSSKLGVGPEHNDVAGGEE